MEGPEGPTCSEEGFLSRMALNDNKAGMEGLDRDKINKIILQTSKGSRFYENELKKEQQVNQRIERMLQQKAHITEQQLRKAQAQVEKMAVDLERGRDLGRIIVHVDMDAFYAAVEMRDCPELKDKPMAVGSMSMLSTSNYHARKFGVRAAMPGFIAKKLCPGLIIVPLNFEKYRAVSTEVREIFADYDPHFLPMSLDEAYLDISEHLEQRLSWPDTMRTHYVRADATAATAEGAGMEEGPQGADDLSPVLFEDSPMSPPSPRGAEDWVVFGTGAEEAVREMRFRIEQRTTLTASAGIAPNMMLAKVCSDKNKPNGQYRIPAQRQAVMDFIQNLPIRKVSGIGKVTEMMLKALEITTCSQFCQKGALLSLLFSEVSWHHFLQISLGLGSTHIERDCERKSMSMERTFGEMSRADQQYDLCRELCRDLAHDLQKEDLKGKTVTVKLKNVNFEVKTRASTLSSVVSSEAEIFAVAKDLLKTEIDSASPQPLRLRLMGVRVSGFVSSDDRKSLQKSIISFLQSGRSHGAPQEGTPHSLLSESAPDHQAVRPAPLLSGALKQAGVSHTVTQESKASPAKRDQTPTILDRPTEEGQSFFQRAHAQRLRQQTGWSDACSSSSSTPCGEPLPCTPTVFMPAVFMPAVFTPTVFTCPVCFQQQESSDLRSFNRHVDDCLGTASAQRHGTGTNGCPGVGACVGDEQSSSRYEWALSKVADETDARAGSSACQDASQKSNVNPLLNSLGSKPAENSTTGTFYPKTSTLRSFPFGSGEEVSDEDAFASEESVGVRRGGGESKAPRRAAGPTPTCPALTSPALTCPVCNRQQDTNDLVLFNRHVDVCLNQGVLLELEREPLSHNSNVTAGTKVEGKPENGQSAPKPSSKNRRHGSPPLPPPKKAKVLLPRNTIDRFFR